MKMRPFFKMVFRTVSLVVLLLVTACDKVTLPPSDNTPPTLRWTIYNDETSEATIIAGNGRVSMGSGNHVWVTLIAEDPQGVHKISLSASGTHTCRSGDGVKMAPALSLMSGTDNGGTPDPHPN